MASRAVANEVMTSARLDEIVEYRTTLYTQTGYSTSTGAKTANVNVGYLEVPSVAYPSLVRVSGSCWGILDSGASWTARLGYDITADPTSTSTDVVEVTLQRGKMDNPSGGDESASANMTGAFLLAANTAAWVRLTLYRTGGTFSLGTAIGQTLCIDRTERFPAA